VRQAALAEVKDDLSRFLRLAESEEILITRHGKPAGVLPIFPVAQTGALTSGLSGGPRTTLPRVSFEASGFGDQSSESQTSWSFWFVYWLGGAT
jgi:hypothetical protein